MDFRLLCSTRRVSGVTLLTVSGSVLEGWLLGNSSINVFGFTESCVFRLCFWCLCYFFGVRLNNLLLVNALFRKNFAWGNCFLILFRVDLEVRLWSYRRAESEAIPWKSESFMFWALQPSANLFHTNSLCWR